MSIKELVGKAQTVLGAIDAEELGITLPHEHCLIDQAVWFIEPTACSEKLMAHQPVSLENLWYVRYHIHNNLDNIQFLDETLAVEETTHFKLAGGSTIVDMTSIGLGRDPMALTRISRATGLNIIMGCGYYVEDAHPRGVKLTEEMVAEEMVRDITVGVDNTGIRSGIIGEIGISWPMREGEKTVLRAAARAQKQTGAPINIHPGRKVVSPFEVIKILSGAGADISRVVISHVERTIPDHDTRVKLAQTGCYLEYDVFSFEGWFPILKEPGKDRPVVIDLPNDSGRINAIIALIKEGYLNQILISHDHCFKTRLRRYGGPGYAHILNNVVPLMQNKGMPEEHINALLVENPKRLLQFV